MPVSKAAGVEMESGKSSPRSVFPGIPGRGFADYLLRLFQNSVLEQPSVGNRRI
jgi:hypothetical protein